MCWFAHSDRSQLCEYFHPIFQRAFPVQPELIDNLFSDCHAQSKVPVVGLDCNQRCSFQSSQDQTV